MGSEMCIRDSAKSARQSAERESAPLTKAAETISAPARAFCALLGAFLAVFELSHLTTLLPALFTGRLRVSGFRTGAHSFYWSEQPLVFSFNLLVGYAEVLIIGAIAWGCVRAALVGRFKAAP